MTSSSVLELSRQLVTMEQASLDRLTDLLAEVRQLRKDLEAEILSCNELLAQCEEM